MLERSLAGLRVLVASDHFELGLLFATIITVSGGIVERAVPALIAQPGHLHTNLLGMTFLNRMERWEMNDDKLVLRGSP